MTEENIMASQKPKQNDIAESPLGSLAAKVLSQSKVWASLTKQIEECFLSPSNAPKPLLDPFRVTILLPQISAHLKVVGDPCEKEVSNLQLWATQECRRLLTEFEQELRNFCTAEKLQLDGRYPNFIVQGFLEINVQDTQPVCKIAEKSFKTLLFPVLASPIREAIRQDVARNFDAGQLLQDLYKAYQRAVAAGQLAEGDPVLAKHLLPELAFVKQSPAFKKSPSKANFIEYTLDRFARDLAQLLNERTTLTTNGKRLHPTPVSNSSDGIPILIDGAYRYIGRLNFVDETAQ